MKRRLSERELDRLLAEAPRQTASPGFSRRVLAKLEPTVAGAAPASEAPVSKAPATGRRAGSRWLLAGAAATLALAAGLWLVPRADRSPATGPRALAAEHQALVRELDALKDSLRAEAAPPLLYLGGNESVDLVLDLRPVWGERRGAAVRPALDTGGESPRSPANFEGEHR